mgnify:FL=1
MLLFQTKVFYNFAKLVKIKDMAKEKERKFLVNSPIFREMAVKKCEIMQAYLSRSVDATIRIRVFNDEARLTVKSKNQGDLRNEWEYTIPREDAEEMLTLCQEPPLTKTRWIVPYADRLWEVDEFHGPLEGLTVAEIELPEDFGDKPLTDVPEFVGKEVTDNPAYYNSNLIKHGKPNE